MADPVVGVAQQASGAVDGSNLAQVIAQAVAAGVTASLNEITAKVNQLQQSISEALKKESTNSDTNFETTVTGAHDLYESLRRADLARDRVGSYAELALSQALQANANAIEIAKAIGARSCDHFSSLPPVSAKVSGC
jgi:hypothetical protein